MNSVAYELNLSEMIYNSNMRVFVAMDTQFTGAKTQKVTN